MARMTDERLAGLIEYNRDVKFGLETELLDALIAEREECEAARSSEEAWEAEAERLKPFESLAEFWRMQNGETNDLLRTEHRVSEAWHRMACDRCNGSISCEACHEGVNGNA